MTRGRAVVGAIVCMALGAVLARAVTAATEERTRPAAVDVGFLQDMIDHHDQAVQMAVLEMSNGSAPVARALAGDVIASQRYEIGLMEAWLEEWGEDRGAPARRVMAWMGMSLPHHEMPGLATQQSIDALAKAAGADADALFFRLMIEHHRGGVHMAEFASRHARVPRVRELAERMIRTQGLEIGEMQTAQGRLGLAP